MSRAVQEWSDARLNDLAAAIQPVPIQIAALTEAVDHLDELTSTLRPLASQVAALTATVEQLTDENRALRDEIAATQRLLLQIACGFIATLLAAAGALISVLH
jgi:outer membrane murein-binding lipoprotein Lpp